jgi:transposase
MMGTKARNTAPLSNISLEDLAPQDHLYRHLDQKLDLSFVREFVQETYAQRGRPSIDPMVFFKLQLVMFFEGIRSERELMRQAADRLSVLWYLGYNLKEPLPEHSSLTRIRTRYGVEVFRRFFETVVDQCQQAGLVWGKELYADATKVQANAAVSSLKPRFAVEAHLENLFASGRTQAQTDDLDGLQGDGSPADLSPLASTEHPSLAETSPGAGHVEPVEQEEPPVPRQLHPSLDVALHEALTKVNSARHDWIERVGEPNREITRGNYQRMADFQVSTTDPDATLMQGKAGGSHLGYHTHYIVDGGKARIILAALVTPSEVMENQPVLDLLWRTRFRWKLHARQFTGDTTYGTAENIVALEEQQIRAYVPLPDFDKRTEFFGQRDFRYDAEQDVYICPNGAELHYTASGSTEDYRLYWAKAKVCNACPLKAQCTTSSRGRRLSRHVDEDYLERVRTYHTTEPYKKAMRKRNVWVEPFKASGKQWHGMRRYRLRRLWRVNCEALIRAAGQNLKRLLKKRGWGRRPWPEGTANALSEPPSEELIPLHAPSLTEKALAYGPDTNIGDTRGKIAILLRVLCEEWN